MASKTGGRIDYSKWDNLGDSSDEEPSKKEIKDSAAKALAQPAPKDVVVPTVQRPKEAKGSVWNTGNYHWEEKKLDKWGEARLRELIEQVPAIHDFEAEGARLHFVHSLSIKELEGDCWNHIRKGKHVIGYNYEFVFGIAGSVLAGTREEKVIGTLNYDFMVDDKDASSSFELTSGGSLPFVAQIKTFILASLTSKLQVFVTELQSKGASDVQTASAHGVQPKVSPAIQVGAHNKEGKRLS